MAAGGSSCSVAVVCSPGAPQSDKGMPGFSRHAMGRGQRKLWNGEKEAGEKKGVMRKKELNKSLIPLCAVFTYHSQVYGWAQSCHSFKINEAAKRSGGLE